MRAHLADAIEAHALAAAAVQDALALVFDVRSVRARVVHARARRRHTSVKGTRLGIVAIDSVERRVGVPIIALRAEHRQAGLAQDAVGPVAPARYSARETNIAAHVRREGPKFPALVQAGFTAEFERAVVLIVLARRVRRRCRRIPTLLRSAARAVSAWYPWQAEFRTVTITAVHLVGAPRIAEHVLTAVDIRRHAIRGIG